jgi:hypothetical protein
VRALFWLLLVPVGLWEALAWRWRLPSISEVARAQPLLRAAVAGAILGWWYVHSDPILFKFWP